MGKEPNIFTLSATLPFPGRLDFVGVTVTDTSEGAEDEVDDTFSPAALLSAFFCFFSIFLTFFRSFLNSLLVHSVVGCTSVVTAPEVAGTARVVKVG